MLFTNQKNVINFGVIVFMIACVVLIILGSPLGAQEDSQDAEVTIIMNPYKDLRARGDNISFDIVEEGAGIKYYTWELFPASMIDGLIEHINGPNTHGVSNWKTNYIDNVGHEISAIDSDNMQKSREALANGKSVVCSVSNLREPARITLNVPPGKYYIDYSCTLYGECDGHKKFAPIEYGTRAHDWGPHEFSVTEGGELVLACTPNGGNTCSVSGGLNYFLSYLILNNRIAYLKH